MYSTESGIVANFKLYFAICNFKLQKLSRMGEISKNIILEQKFPPGVFFTQFNITNTGVYYD